MAVHDWSRVDPCLFHDFHQSWTISICNALNGGHLPKGYSALVEQNGYPSNGGISEFAVKHGSPEEIYAQRGNRITIRHPLHRIISVIQIVSPGNKGSRSALRAFVEKTVEFLNHGIHVLVDLLPPSNRDPQGFTRQSGTRLRIGRSSCRRTSR